MEQEKYFYCYNKEVSDYLASKGIKYINVARELKSNKIYSLYKQTEQLTKALTEYKNK